MISEISEFVSRKSITEGNKLRMLPPVRVNVEIDKSLESRLCSVIEVGEKLDVLTASLKVKESNPKSISSEKERSEGGIISVRI